MEGGVMGEDMGGNGDKGGLWGDRGMGVMGEYMGGNEGDVGGYGVDVEGKEDVGG